MQRMKTETLKLNVSGNTPCWNDANQAPATPPKNAPDAYDHVFVRMSGMPIAAAAVSSSRIAIQARPSLESRNRIEQNSVTSTSASAPQYMRSTKSPTGSLLGPTHHPNDVRKFAGSPSLSCSPRRNQASRSG